MLKRIKLFLFGFTLWSVAISQNDPSELFNSLGEAENTKDSLAAITQLANWYLYEDADSASYFLVHLKRLAQSLPDANELMNYYRYQGIYMADQLGQSLEGRQMFFQSLQIADSLNSRLGRELAYTELGYNYRVVGQLDSSNLYFNKSLQVLEEGDSIGKASILNGVGLNYKSVGAVDEATSAFFEVLKLVEGNYGYETVIYYNLRLLYESQNEFNEAEKYARKALIAAKKGGNKFSTANSEQALGGILLKTYQLDSAEFHLNKSIQLASELGANTILINAKSHFAKLRMNQKNWKEAFQIIQEIKTLLPPDRLFTNFSINNLEASYYMEKTNPSPQKALSIIDRMESSLDQSMLEELKPDIYKAKAEVYKKLDPSLSLEYYMKYDSLEKKLNSEKLKQYSKLLLTKYETEKKDREIESLTQQSTIQSLQLSQRNSQLLIGGLIATVLLVGGFLYYQNDRNKKSKASSELQQRFLRSQLNPHFIFNSMTAIQNYLITHKDAEEASYYMGVFSSLMRQILENSRQEFIPLEEEIKMLNSYIELQKIRFNQDLEFHMEVDDDLDSQYHCVPPMFAQPFVENCIEHGLFQDNDRDNKLTVRFKMVDEAIIRLEIEDNGTGMQDQKGDKEHNSLATKITHERLSSLEFTYKKSFKMISENMTSSDGTVLGYRVHLTLPSKVILSA